LKSTLVEAVLIPLLSYRSIFNNAPTAHHYIMWNQSPLATNIFGMSHVIV